MLNKTLNNRLFLLLATVSLVGSVALIAPTILAPVLTSPPTGATPPTVLAANEPSLERRGTGSQPFSQNESSAGSSRLSQDALAKSTSDYGRLPLSFEVNNGQSDSRVKFLARGQGYGLFLTSTGVVLSLNKISTARNDQNAESASSQSAVLSMSLKGARPAQRIAGVDELPGKVNYFVGNDPRKWRTGVQTYAKVRYEGVYPGIDLVYYGNQRQLEYDFIVSPRANPDRIKLSFAGASSARVDEHGDLLLTTSGGEVVQRKAIVYQEVAGERREIAAAYRVEEKTVSFDLGSYDKSLPLIIDPVLLYSSFLGAGNFDSGLAIAVDAQGSAFLTGNTFSIDFPLADPFQATNQGLFEDAFVTKLNPAGTALVYSTYLGGTVSDSGNSIAIDPQGNAYVVGVTNSDDFPITSGSYQGTKDGILDGFVTKLNPAGSALVYSTYLGGDNTDTPYGVAVSADGRAHVAGRTESTHLGFTPLQRHGHPVFKSLSGGANWSASDTGLTASNVIAFALDPSNSNVVYAATTNGVFKSTNAGTSWSRSGTDDFATAPENATSVVVDPSNPNTIYVGTLDRGIHKSTNGGALYALKNNGLFIESVNALAIDPLNPATLYAATVFGMFKTTNGGDTWVGISTGIVNIAINELAIDPVNTAVVYAGTQRGMYKTINGGGGWFPINEGPINAGTPILVLAIDPLNPTTLYAAANFSAGTVFKTINGGTNWTSLTNGLPPSNVTAIAVDPVLSATLYAGTSILGVYKSTDSGASWTESNSGLTNVAINALLVDRNNPATVYAGAAIGGDAFAVRFNQTGSTVEQLMSFGGDENDEARGVALDSTGLPYLIGSTSSTNFPLANAFQSTKGAFSDAFVAKLNAAGSGFMYSTYLGGNGTDQGRAIAVRAESAYIAGITSSSNFPTSNAYQPALNQVGTDAFVTKFNPAGSALEFSTYFGGGSSEQGLGVAVDIEGNTYLTGSTSSEDLPTLEAPQSVRGGQTDAFVTKFNATGASLAYSTYLGGTSADQGNGIAVDQNGNAYIIGNTASAGFPTANAFQPTKGSGTDAFVTKIGIQADLSVQKRDSRDPVLVNSPFTYTLTVNNSGPSSATGVTVMDTLPSSLTLNSATPTQGTCSLNNSILTCNLGTLAPAAGAVIAVSVTPTATGTITNTATVTGNEPDVNSANNTAAETTKISASPSIKGHVKDTSNVGVSGVLMTLTGTEARTVQTDSAGFYQFAELTAGGNYVITPTKANLSIDPESVTFNGLNADQTADFVALVCTYSITPLTSSFSAAGGTGTVSVTSLRGCPWTATSSDSWLSITSGASGFGSGTVNFSVSPTTVPRVAHLTIAGLNFAVYQEFSSCGAPGFSITNYSFSGSPTKAESADLNGDGSRDLVVLSGIAGEGIVMLNNGAGSFSTSGFGIGFLPQDFVIRDFNGDNKPDMAFSSYNFSAVRILFNNGSGGFGGTTDVPFTSQGQSPLTRGLFSADLNNDGKADLLVWTPGASAVQVLLASGGSGFSQVAPVVGNSFDVPIGIVDVNDDGKPDLIYGGGGDNSRPISVRAGNGAGGFGSQILSSGMSVTAYMGTADFNGDAKLDLVASAVGGSSNTVAVLTGDGTGLFTLKSSFVVGQGSIPNPTVADFNRDGKPDVAFVNGGSKVTVLFGDGLGGLGNAIPIDTGASDVTGGNFGITSADFNGDGRPDMGVADYSRGASVLLNSCPSGSTSLSINDINVIEGNTGTVNAVFNVNLSAPSGGTVSVSYNTGNGTATAGSDYVASSGLVSFTPGETTKTLTVPVHGDPLTEPNETFVVNLFTPQNATISKALGTGTILNDDATLQMSSQSYLISEDQLRVDITVTRTGDTSGAASVTFTTNDAAGLQNCNVFNGIASPRCDFIVQNGTVAFAAGETSKTFSIAIINDSYAEGTENFTITLSNASGASLGSQSNATVMIVDNESVTGPNPIDQTPFFVRQQYLDFLGREPDPPGEAAWIATINNCPQGDITCDRIHVSSIFFRSAEFQGRGYFVYRFYPVSFGRKPDYDEFVPDLAQVSGFLSDAQLEAAKVAFIAEFMSRPAFVGTYNGLNNTQYVDTLLNTAGVMLSSRQQMIDGLNAGTLTRVQVLRQIAESGEVAARYFNQAYAVMEYFGYLRRQPDAFYLDWIAVLDGGVSPRTMATGFVNSAEYRQRFGP